MLSNIEAAFLFAEVRELVVGEHLRIVLLLGLLRSSIERSRRSRTRWHEVSGVGLVAHGDVGGGGGEALTFNGLLLARAQSSLLTLEE